jgi:hypothetical protein
VNKRRAAKLKRRAEPAAATASPVRGRGVVMACRRNRVDGSSLLLRLPFGAARTQVHIFQLDQDIAVVVPVSKSAKIRARPLE